MGLDAGEEIMIVICFIALCFCVDSIFEKYFNARWRFNEEEQKYEMEEDDDQEGE